MNAPRFPARIEIECLGKQAFPTPQIAAQVERRLRASRRGKNERPAEHYRCAHCGLWHLGRLG